MIQCPGNKEWMRYIDGTLSFEEQFQYEVHLYTCDRCLATFSQCVEGSSIPLPKHQSELVNQLVAALPGTGTTLRKVFPLPTALAETGELPVSKNWFEQTLFHYAVACIITLVLTASGIFSGVLTQVDEYTKSIETNPSKSLAEQITGRTTHLIDQLQRFESESEGEIDE